MQIIQKLIFRSAYWEYYNIDFCKPVKCHGTQNLQEKSEQPDEQNAHSNLNDVSKALRLIISSCNCIIHINKFFCLPSFNRQSVPLSSSCPPQEVGEFESPAQVLSCFQHCIMLGKLRSRDQLEPLLQLRGQSPKCSNDHGDCRCLPLFIFLVNSSEKLHLHSTPCSVHIVGFDNTNLVNEGNEKSQGTCGCFQYF